MWVALGLLSCVFLGIYDILKKLSVKKESVLFILWISTFTTATVCIPIHIFTSQYSVPEQWLVSAPNITFHYHIFAKSIIVSTSWIFSYLALQNLPLSIVTPIRASGPLWTIAGGIIIFGEKISLGQWTGIGIMMTFYFIFSRIGKAEGIHFHKNKWIFAIFIATIIGTISSLYDKYLLQRYTAMSVQVYFSYYLFFVFSVFYILRAIIKKRPIFKGRNFSWTIPMIGISLMTADCFYFFALSDQESYISILSALRRSSVLISFCIGAYVFNEVNLKKKGMTLLGILLGVSIILYSSV